MKMKILNIVKLSLFIAVLGCTDSLELTPLDRVSGEILFDTEDGIKTVVADMYHRIPVENFWYRPNAGFNQLGAESAGAMISTDHFTDDACLSHGSGWSLTASYWPYNNIRYANIFLETFFSCLHLFWIGQKIWWGSFN
jgi:starch-binding outer membrane protein, SusD/RagB family